VVNGSPSEIAGIRDYINKKGLQDAILLNTKLPFKKLVEEYQDALALLIPLRTTQQDAARFPHKIGEYIATGRPIITGNVGEINSYFFNRETAFIAEEFTVDAYARLMEGVVGNKSLANVIGEKGRKLGEQRFHYSPYGATLSNFLSAL
jgi:glycosyltransferase involved in cell wall biosynthesis